MKIAVIETQPHGGLLHYAVQLGDALAARGHDVELITPRRNELVGRARHARMRPVLAATRPHPEWHAPAAGAGRVVARAGVGMRLARAWARVNWEVLRGDYDVVLLTSDVLTPLGAAGAWMLTRQPRRRPLAHVCHNAVGFRRGRETELSRTNPISEAFLRRTYPRFDLVFLHGGRTRAQFERTWPPARLAEIPHGDERIFGDDPPVPSGEEHILFFGDWKKVKGISVLMEAFDMIATRRPATTLTMAGTPIADEIDVGAIERWAQAHDGRVELIGRYVPIEEVPALFARARVVTTPYLVGYQSGVVHLAMTMSRAVVASDVGDLGSVVVDDETGFLVEPGDARGLAEALERVICDPALAAKLGANARDRLLAGSSWEKVAERVECHLEPLQPAVRRG